MAGSQLVTRVLYPRFGPRRIIVGGLLIVTGMLVLMAQVTAGADLWLVRLIMLGFGVGMSCVFVSAQAASFATISHALTSKASSVFNAGKQLGGAIGVAMLTTVLAGIGPTKKVAGHVTANLAAYHGGFLAAAAVAVIAVAVTIHDADARRHHGPAAGRGSGQASRGAGARARGCRDLDKLSPAVLCGEMARVALQCATRQMLIP
jgi:MFS family permease